MRSRTFILATGADDGAASATSGPVLGKLFAIKYMPGTIDTGATLTVTCVNADASSKPMLTKANAGTSNAWFYPLDIPHKVEDGGVLTATAGGDRVQPILDGILTVVIASGGNSKLGKAVVYYED
jgi:hypothetical protein